MPLLEEKVYTIDDIYALPEGERAELIDGHIYYTAPPNRTHQKISMEPVSYTHLDVYKRQVVFWWWIVMRAVRQMRPG